MTVSFACGDLFADSSLIALAHGCNCAGAMGKGIALEFRQRFPDMYVEYKDRCKRGLFSLGDVFVWEQSPVIYNLATQESWRQPAQLTAIRDSMTRMIAHAEQHTIPIIGMPKVGAGLGGLQWDCVRSLIIELGSTTPVELRVFENFIKNDTKL